MSVVFVRCCDNSGISAYLTVGKWYKVIREYEDGYLVELPDVIARVTYAKIDRRRFEPYEKLF